MKTKDIVALYALINPSRLSKMTDSKAKFAIIRDNRVLKTISDAYTFFQEDAQKKLQPADFADWKQRAMKWQGKTAKIPDEMKEIGEINAYFARYGSEVQKCLAEESDKDHTVDLEKISEDQFRLFIDSNDWTVDQVTTLYAYLVKE